MLPEIISSMCVPSSTTIKDVHHLAKRNRAILTLLVALIPLLFLCLLFMDDTVKPVLQFTLSSTIITLLVFLLTCRSHVDLFYIFITICLMIFPLILTKIIKDSIFFSWMSTQMNPILVFLLTRKKSYFLIETAGQTLLLLFSYQPFMEEFLKSHTPDYLLNKLTIAACISQATTIIFVGHIYDIFEHNHKTIEQITLLKRNSEKSKIFFMGISHELRNSINSLVGNVDLALNESSPEKVKQSLQNVKVCGDLLIHLVNNTLDTHKAESGELEIVPVSVSTLDTLKRCWGICSEIIKRKGLKGSMKIDKRVPKFLKLDSHRLTQILLNLVGNAAKFTQEGSINITVQWLNGDSRVDSKCFCPHPYTESGLFEKDDAIARINDKYGFMEIQFAEKKVDRDFADCSPTLPQGILKFIVQDTGCGIDEKDLNQVFGKFHQLGNAESRKAGTGLGLYITKQLCLKMKGDIRVYSKVGQGTSFVFCIPTEVGESFRDSVVEKNTERLKVLIADDVPFNIDLLENYLRNLGVNTIETVNDGIRAFNKFVEAHQKKSLFDLIFLDLDMPNSNGKNTALKIRQYEKEHNLAASKIIIMSRNSSETEIKDCITNYHADGFLKKPISTNSVKTIMARHFGRDN